LVACSWLLCFGTLTNLCCLSYLAEVWAQDQHVDKMVATLYLNMSTIQKKICYK